MDRKSFIKDCKKIVIKIGSSTLTHSNGLLNYDMIEKLVRQIANIKNKGYDVILVTSGAIGAGMAKLKLKQKPKTIPEKTSMCSCRSGAFNAYI